MPDLVTTAKGLTSGTVPMGAVMARKHIHDAIVHGPGPGRRRRSSCSTAIPTRPIRWPAPRRWPRSRPTGRRACSSARRSWRRYWEERLHSLRDRRNVIDIRNIGLMGAVELAPRPGKPGERAYDAMLHGLRKG